MLTCCRQHKTILMDLMDLIRLTALMILIDLIALMILIALTFLIDLCCDIKLAEVRVTRAILERLLGSSEACA